MTIANIVDPASVLRAIAEFEELGQRGFLTKYGFGPSKSYWLLHDGRRYDSKAIIGAAHGYARPDLGPLLAADFSGGHSTVKRKLEELGFKIENAANEAPDKTATGNDTTSSYLATGEIYTRDALKSQFSITDATINTGVFRPKGTSSIWLFITQAKTADRTQYRDRLEGDTLHWQGQTSGRTDDLIVRHDQHGLELLVFFRARKYEHPGAGFRYLGPFQYVSHSGGGPADFILKQAGLGSAAAIPANAADEAPFDSSSVVDARQKILRSIAQRRGQRAFRDALINAYGGRCAITGCDVLDVLEAAHIFPYLGPDTNKVDNGLLLRADLHTLFDCSLVGIDPTTLTVVVSEKLRASEYGVLHGRALRPPRQPAQAPSADALQQRRALRS